MADEMGLEPGRLSTETLVERRARLVPSSPEGGVRRASVGRRLGAVVAVSLAVTSVFIGVTAFTGLPWPEPIRRYSVADLARVTDEINRQEQRDAYINRLGNPSPASIDWLRGRVGLDGPIPCGVTLLDESDWDMLIADYDSNTCPPYDSY